MKVFFIAVVLSIAVLLNACNEKSKEADANNVQKTMNDNHSEQNRIDKKGIIVASNEVCMVNDAFMGKKQLEVQYNGKTYYGCCEMCKKRIPNEASVRSAIDPVSKKEVDKATAIIAITGNNGEVSYFENKTTYSDYMKNYKD